MERRRIIEKFSVKTTVRDGSYYVFDDGGFFGEYRSAGKAIVAVSGNKTGVVVDGEGNIVYRALDATSYRSEEHTSELQSRI